MLKAIKETKTSQRKIKNEMTNNRIVREGKVERMGKKI